MEPVHEASDKSAAAPTLGASVEQRLAALRVLLDWVVIGQVIPTDLTGPW